MKALPYLLLLCCWLSSGVAHAEPAPRPQLPPIDIAALAVSSRQLFVGGFDAGLYVVERDGSATQFRDPALSPHINALAWSEPEQVLWLGTARGLTRCRFEKGCERLGPPSAIHALLLRGDGTLVAGGDAGLTFIEGKRSETVGKKQGAPYRAVWSLGENRDGALFVGAINGLFWGDASTIRQHPARLSRASLVTGVLPDDWVTALLPLGTRVLVGTYNAGVVSLGRAPGGLTPLSSDPSLGYVNPAGVVATGNDTFAFATMDGLHAGTPGESKRIQTRARDITAVVPAWQGGYWIGTRQGLEWTEL